MANKPQSGMNEVVGNKSSEQQGRMERKRRRQEQGPSSNMTEEERGSCTSTKRRSSQQQLGDQESSNLTSLSSQAPSPGEVNSAAMKPTQRSISPPTSLPLLPSVALTRSVPVQLENQIKKFGCEHQHLIAGGATTDPPEDNSEELFQSSVPESGDPTPDEMVSPTVTTPTLAPTDDLVYR